MNAEDKRRVLAELAEADLRVTVLIPLLSRMGYRAVCEYHGPREHGKDIVCFDVDRLGQRRYLAVVAKTSDLSGSVSSSSGLLQLVHQAEQCFNEDYHDLFGMRSITMDEVWIMTSGRVDPGAADAVFGKLRKSNLAKLTRIIACEELVQLLDEHYPAYWSASGETADHIRGERDRVRSFLSDLLRELGARETEVAQVLTALKNSS